MKSTYLVLPVLFFIASYAQAIQPDPFYPDWYRGPSDEMLCYAI